MIETRLLNALDALSQLGNSLLLPRPEDTNANESISGRSFREDWRVMILVIDTIFFWDPNHCQNAYLRDLERAKNLVERNRQMSFRFE